MIVSARPIRSLRRRLLVGWSRLRPGASLFETLLTLIVIGAVLAAGAIAINERSLDVRDKASADHLRILAEGAQRMLRENYARLANPQVVPAERLVFQAGAAIQGGIDLTPYLPPGFTTADATSRNAYRQQWRIVTNRIGSGQNVRVNAVVILSEAADSFPLRQGGTVSRREGAIIGLAGPNAGVVDGRVVHGAFGGWQIRIDEDNFLSAGPGAFGPADRMAVVLSADRGGVFGEYLHRQAVPGFPELNRMQTNIDMAGNDLLRVNQIGFGDQSTPAPIDPADPNNPTNATGQIRFVPGGGADGTSGAGVEWTGPWTPNLPGLEIGVAGAVTVDAGRGFRVQTGPGGDVRIESGRNVRIEAGQNGDGTISLDGQDVIVGDPASNGNRGTGNLRAQSLVLRTINDLMFTAPEGSEVTITDPGGTPRLVSLHDLIPRVNLRHIYGAFNRMRVPKPSCPWGTPYVVTTLHSFQTANNSQPMPWETWLLSGSHPEAPPGPIAQGYGNVYYRVGLGPGPDPGDVNAAIAEQRLTVPIRVRAIDANRPLPQDLALYSASIDAARDQDSPEGQWVIVVEYLNQFPDICPGDASVGAFFQNFDGEYWGPSRVTLRPERPGESGGNRCIYEHPDDMGRPFVVVQGFCGAGDGTNREHGAFGASGDGRYVPQGLAPNGGQPWSQPAAVTGTRLPAND